MYELEQAVAEWIRANYQFKFGKDHYSKEVTEAYVKSETRLRRQLTGKGDLEKAYEVLNEQGEQEEETTGDVEAP
jgi:hypothetical protein